jgi:hypothetical protein
MSSVAAPRFRGGLQWQRLRVTSTPARLRVAAAAIIVAALGFGVLGTTVVTSRRDAAHRAATESEPVLLKALDLHDALSDADATVSATFVIGGAEPVARRQRYLADVSSASSALAVLGRQTNNSPEIAGAVLAIGRDLPVYTGLVESARANNRQGFPVGAAYLRQASTLMREQILPAAARVYAVEGRRLSGRYRSGTSAALVVIFAVAAVAIVAVLIGTQLYVARLTRRRLNLPLVAGTAVLLAAAAWGLLGLAAEQRALIRAQRDGSDPVEVLSAVRVLALRAQADEGLSLAARGSGDAYLADFEAALEVLGTPRGLLADAAVLARRQGAGAGIKRLAERFAAYRSVHVRVAALEAEGRFTAAADLSVGEPGRELSIADAIGRDLDRLIAASQRRFELAAADASSAVRVLWIAMPLLTLGGALLALYGVRLRMNEYR